MFVVHGNSVRGLVPVFVVGNHHGDVELLQSIAWEGAADVSTTCSGQVKRAQGGEMKWSEFTCQPQMCSGAESDPRLALGQTTHLVCLIIQAIFSVVHWLAAMMRSPSFSLFSSSITTKNSPAANAASASSMESNAKASRMGASLTSVGRQSGVSGVGSRDGGGWADVPLVLGVEEERGLVGRTEAVMVDCEVATGAIGGYLWVDCGGGQE